MFRKALNQFSYDLYYHIYVWGMCVLTTVLLIVTNTYGISLDGTSCWICKSDKFAQLLFFGPLMLYFLISLFVLHIFPKNNINDDINYNNNNNIYSLEWHYRTRFSEWSLYFERKEVRKEFSSACFSSSSCFLQSGYVSAIDQCYLTL